MLDTAPAVPRVRMRFRSGAARLPQWLRFDRRDIGLALALNAIWVAVGATGSYALLQEPSMLEFTVFSSQVFLEGIVVNFLIIAALKAAEQLPLQGWRRHLATVATGVIVTAAIDGPILYVQWWPWSRAALTYGITATPLAFLFFAMWQNTLAALIARAWLVRSHDEADASRLLAQMRSEQMSVRRRLVEGRLKAIQARVDPLFFFSMLEAVRETYEIDVSRAEQLLDELTTFLRAALPRLRTASSTVDQECELARSFARLRVMAGLGSARLEVEVAPSIEAASFPPGVLLPLIGELLCATTDAGSVGLSFVSNAEQRIIMQLTAQARPSNDALAKTRATLLDLFGSAASVAVASGVTTTVDIPYEPASA